MVCYLTALCDYRILSLSKCGAARQPVASSRPDNTREGTILPFSAAQSAFQCCPICLSAPYNVPFCRSFELAWAWRKQTASDTVHAVTALLEVTTAKQAAAPDDTKDRFW